MYKAVLQDGGTNFHIRFMYGFDDITEKSQLNRMHRYVWHSWTALFYHILIALAHFASLNTSIKAWGSYSLHLDAPISD